MSVSTYKMIYLGKFSDIDADETTNNAERATQIFAGRTIGSRGLPLYDRVTNVRMNDTNNDGRIFHNNASGTQETITYSLNNITYSRELDGAFVATNVTIVRMLPNGTTDKVTTTVRIFQDTSGETFMIPPPVAGGNPGEIAAVTTYPIVSIQLPTNTAYYNTNLNVASADRYDMAAFVPCFVTGTLIETDQGQCRVETIAVGDLVMTRDHGLQPVRWRSSRRIGPDELRTNPKLLPIRIAAGALGANQPSRDLLVSPQHRILVRSAIARRMFGADELLVPARQLLDLPSVSIVQDAHDVTYVHLMFDHHEVLMSNGAQTESLYPGPQALAALGEKAEQEIMTIFPWLSSADACFGPARAFATGLRARKLIDRHIRHNRPLNS
ncbi:Hint domain-containing protein [Paracoccus amoyensis]